MPCTVDHYNDNRYEKPHRKAAKRHVDFLEVTGREVPKELRTISEGSNTACPVKGTEVQDLCAVLRKFGGSGATAALVSTRPRCKKAVRVHAWCVDHERWDVMNERLKKKGQGASSMIIQDGEANPT